MSAMKKLIAPVVTTTLLLTGCGSTGPAADHSKMNHSSAGTEPGTAAPTGGSYLDETIPESVKTLPLFNESEATVSLDSYKGKWLVLTNFLTSCQEVCPMTTALMNSIAYTIKTGKHANEFSFAEISVDSKSDTASRLKAYKEVSNSTHLDLISGNESSLKELWKYFGAPYEVMSIDAKEAADLPVDWQTGKKPDHDVMHPDLVLIISPDQHWRWINLGSPDASRVKVPLKLQNFLSADGKEHMVNPQQPSWTSDSVYSALTALSGVKFS